MFAAVVMERSPGGIWQQMGQWVRPPVPRAEHLGEKGMRYWLIHVPDRGRRGPDWEAVAEVAGRQRGRLLIDPSVPLSDDAPVCRFEPDRFRRRLAFNTVKAALSRSRVELWKRTVGVLDPAACCQQQVMELLSYATCVKVYTDRPDRYEAFCSQMLELYGAPVLLCHSREALSDCLLAVAAPTAPSLRLDDGCPVVCAREGAGCGLVVDSLACEAPGELAPLCPVGMDVTYFLGAMYELGHRRELGELLPVSCRVGGRVAKLEELTALVTARARGIMG